MQGASKKPKPKKNNAFFGTNTLRPQTTDLIKKSRY